MEKIFITKNLGATKCHLLSHFRNLLREPEDVPPSAWRRGAGRGVRKPGSPPYMALEPVLLWPGAAGDTRQRYQQCGLNRDVGDPETQRCPEPGLTRGPFPLGLSRQLLGPGVSLMTLTLLGVSPSPEHVTVLPSPGLSVPVMLTSTPTHPFIQQKTAKNPREREHLSLCLLLSLR